MNLAVHAALEDAMLSSEYTEGEDIIKYVQQGFHTQLCRKNSVCSKSVLQSNAGTCMHVC